jgi:acetolactate synthase-1/2/3 large subunit
LAADRDPPATATSVSDYVARWLLEREISHVFTLPGGLIAPLLDAIHRHGGPALVTMHHEQGVAFAVDGFGRFNGAPAVGLTTGGPGGTNTLTGIASAWFDSVPAVFLMGQVQSYLLKGDRPLRQFGMQECDVATMAEPVTKAIWRLRSGDDVPAALDDALALAGGGRPGPVLVELPVDVQNMRVGAGASRLGGARAGAAAAAPAPPPPAAVAELLDAVAAAGRPAILAGGGVWAAHAADRCRELAGRLGVPVAASMAALDVLPASDPNRLGLVGMFGNRWANLALAEADLVLALGCRLDLATIGADVAAWSRGKRVFQVDCDAAEMRRVRGVRAIEADLGAFLDAALPLATRHGERHRPAWRERIEELRRDSPDTAELDGCDGINPNVLMRQLSAASASAAAIVLDTGQHAWWACQSIQPRAGQRLITALGLGACGFALPAAIGVAVSCGRPVAMVAGDGAFQLNIQELQTVARSGLPIKLVIVDNRCHGSVRQVQEQLFGGRYPSTVLGYDVPDFARVAEAYGIAGMAVSEPDEVEDALAWLWRDEARPALLHVSVPLELNVYPHVPFGASTAVMERAPAAVASVSEEAE